MEALVEVDQVPSTLSAAYEYEGTLFDAASLRGGGTVVSVVHARDFPKVRIVLKMTWQDVTREAQQGEVQNMLQKNWAAFLRVRKTELKRPGMYFWSAYNSCSSSTTLLKGVVPQDPSIKGKGRALPSGPPASTPPTNPAPPRLPHIRWEGTPVFSARTTKLIEWCKENETARIRLFSDSTQDAKEAGRKKEVSGVSKKDYFQQLAKQIFVNDSNLQLQTYSQRKKETLDSEIAHEYVIVPTRGNYKIQQAAMLLGVPTEELGLSDSPIPMKSTPEDYTWEFGDVENGDWGFPQSIFGTPQQILGIQGGEVWDVHSSNWDTRVGVWDAPVEVLGCAHNTLGTPHDRSGDIQERFGFAPYGWDAALEVLETHGRSFGIQGEVWDGTGNNWEPRGWEFGMPVEVMGCPYSSW
ncbi:hypothetical protein BU15DRAFT_65926 [Melanogaster broomeanus]|nr:hypothetical protein BU15DRAFT_65926 [Melanogaster broomeanus]